MSKPKTRRQKKLEQKKKKATVKQCHTQDKPNRNKRVGKQRKNKRRSTPQIPVTV